MLALVGMEVAGGRPPWLGVEGSVLHVVALLAVCGFNSSSWMSSALSICFCASFSALFAKLASPAVSNQLIPGLCVVVFAKYYNI